MDRIALLLLNPLSFTFGSLGGGFCKLDQGVHMAGEKTLLLIHVKFMEIHVSDIVRISVFQRNHGKIYRISRVFKGVPRL